VIANYGDYRIVITSEIKFLDGHYETGPSTAFAGQFQDKRGFDEVATLIDSTIAEMTRERFGAGFLNELRYVIRPGNPDDDSKEMMEVVYSIDLSTTLYFPDGTSRDFKEIHERRRRLSRNSLY
jgi:hypothetical protein